MLDEPPHHNFDQFMNSGRTMKVSLTPGRFQFPADKNVRLPSLVVSLSLSSSTDVDDLVSMLLEI